MSLFGFLASQISPIHSLSERPLRLSPSRLKRQFDAWGGAREDAETYAAEKIVAPGGELRPARSTGVTRAAIAVPEESGYSRA